MRLSRFFMATTGILLVSTIALYFIGGIMPVADVDMLKRSQTALVFLTIAASCALLIVSDN